MLVKIKINERVLLLPVNGKKRYFILGDTVEVEDSLGVILIAKNIAEKVPKLEPESTQDVELKSKKEKGKKT